MVLLHTINSTAVDVYSYHTRFVILGDGGVVREAFDHVAHPPSC